MISVMFASLPLLAALVDFVNPFVGTDKNGHCFPGAACPFGMVQASPDTGRGDWHHCSGYRYGETNYFGFSQTHLSGTGLGELGDWRILPLDPKCSGVAGKDPAGWHERIDKTRETAAPGYYALTGAESGIRTEVTVRPHSAIYRMTPSKDGQVSVLLDFGWTLGGWPAPEGSIVRHMEAEVKEAGRIVEAFRRTKAWVEREIALRLEFREAPWRVERKSDRYLVVHFRAKAGVPLLLRLGVSARDAKSATANLAAEIADWDFESVRNRTRTEWEDLLSRAVIDTDSHKQKIKWYTALYHLYLHPSEISDVGAHTPVYSAVSVWDVFRAAWPFMLLTVPDRAASVVRGLVAQGRRQGYLPIWGLWGSDGLTMVGHHTVSMIAEAWEKGCRDFDVEAAYALVKESLTAEHGRYPVREIFQPKENWALYDRYGYYPCDLIPGESVSRTLECSYDDACAARFARSLGHHEDAAFFARRSMNWTNVIDRSIGYARGRRSDGSWRDPFDPKAIGHSAETDNDFTEGNAWQYSWHVLQNPERLIGALGGRTAALAKLDGLFAETTEYDARHFDVDGLVGQYAHGNEPSHHVVFLYQYLGRPDRTAKWSREIVGKLYGTGPDGLCGNEDCGQMSAWFLFATAGFYPVDPASGTYVLGAPQARRMTFRIAPDKTFAVVGKDFAENARLVKSVSLASPDGRRKPMHPFLLKHADVMSGGELRFDMSDRE